MLQWGFYGAPDRMTESAKKAFLNAIVYMRQFDGHRPLVRKESRGRTWYRQYIATVRKYSAPEQKLSDGYREYLLGHFPDDLIEKHGFNADALSKWFAANEEFIHAVAGGGLGVDVDMAGLGISNRKPAFLDWLTAHLSKDPEHALALRLAARYLPGEHGKSAASALAYIKDNRPWLFFSDTGGYRWFVNTLARDEARAAEASTKGQR